MGTILLILVAVVAVVAWILVSRGKQIGELARRGVPATATVTRRFRTGAGNAGSMGKRLGFTYTGPDGQSYERFATVTSSRYSGVQEGDPFPIYLLPDAPGTSAPAWIVDAARDALAKKS